MGRLTLTSADSESGSQGSTSYKKWLMDADFMFIGTQRCDKEFWQVTDVEFCCWFFFFTSSIIKCKISGNSNGFSTKHFQQYLLPICDQQVRVRKDKSRDIHTTELGVRRFSHCSSTGREKQAGQLCLLLTSCCFPMWPAPSLARCPFGTCQHTCQPQTACPSARASLQELGWWGQVRGLENLSVVLRIAPSSQHCTMGEGRGSWLKTFF